MAAKRRPTPSAYYVYARCWAGFSPQFPHYEALNPLPDDLILPRLQGLLAAWQNENRDHVAQLCREKRTQIRDSLRKRAAQAVFHGASAKRNVAQHPEYRLPDVNDLIWVASVAGWGHIPARAFGGLSPSRRMFIFRAADQKATETVIEGLRLWLRSTSSGRDLHDSFNVRFGHIEGSRLSDGERIAADLCMRESLRGKQSSDVQERLAADLAMKAADVAAQIEPKEPRATDSVGDTRGPALRLAVLRTLRRFHLGLDGLHAVAQYDKDGESLQADAYRTMDWVPEVFIHAEVDDEHLPAGAMPKLFREMVARGEIAQQSMQPIIENLEYTRPDGSIVSITTAKPQPGAALVKRLVKNGAGHTFNFVGGESCFRLLPEGFRELDAADLREHIRVGAVSLAAAGASAGSARRQGRPRGGKLGVHERELLRLARDGIIDKYIKGAKGVQWGQVFAERAVPCLMKLKPSTLSQKYKRLRDRDDFDSLLANVHVDKLA